MRKARKRKCRHCRRFFHPDPRNANKQRYCSRPECRKVSKAASQKKWLAKPKNRDYFRGPLNTQRVQEWRRCNPGYWKNKHGVDKPLQDHSNAKTSTGQEVTGQLTRNALQDLLSTQDTVFLGLLAQLSGSALQDDIVITGRRLQQLGQDILTQPFCCKGGHHDNQQTAPVPSHDPPGSGSIQLGGSPPGS